jgi:hypothetical protein
VTQPSDPVWPPKGLAKPAQRALANAGVASLEDLAGRSEPGIASLHGMGPDAMRVLREAMAARGLTFSA